MKAGPHTLRTEAVLPHTDYKLNVTPDFLSNDGRNVCRTFNDETKLCHVSEVEPKSGNFFNEHHTEFLMYIFVK